MLKPGVWGLWWAPDQSWIVHIWTRMARLLEGWVVEWVYANGKEARRLSKRRLPTDAWSSTCAT